MTNVLLPHFQPPLSVVQLLLILFSRPSWKMAPLRQRVSMIHPGGVCIGLCLIVTPRILTMLADCINCLVNIIALGRSPGLSSSEYCTDNKPWLSPHRCSTLLASCRASQAWYTTQGHAIYLSSWCWLFIMVKIGLMKPRRQDREVFNIKKWFLLIDGVKMERVGRWRDEWDTNRSIIQETWWKTSVKHLSHLFVYLMTLAEKAHYLLSDGWELFSTLEG